MTTMDEYSDQILAEIDMPKPSQKIVIYILDEPIAEIVKRGLLKPLYPGKYLPSTFQNHHKLLPAHFIIYADFEALTTKIEGPELNPMKSNTVKRLQHEACSYSYCVLCCDGEKEPLVEY